jgi:hypothetical protein
MGGAIPWGVFFVRKPRRCNLRKFPNQTDILPTALLSFFAGFDFQKKCAFCDLPSLSPPKNLRCIVQIAPLRHFARNNLLVSPVLSNAGFVLACCGAMSTFCSRSRKYFIGYIGRN